MLDLVYDVYFCLGCVLLGRWCDVEIGYAPEKCDSVAQCGDVSLDRICPLVAFDIICRTDGWGFGGEERDGDAESFR